MKLSRRSRAHPLRTFFCTALLVSVGLTIVAGPTRAQPASYPQKTIKLVIPFPAGGATDILGRTLAQKLGMALNQQVIVENKPGAGGTIGADTVAKAAPDGYTLLMATSSTHSIAPAINPKMPYDAFTDFIPIAHFANAPSVMVVGQSFPAKTLQEAVGVFKSNPGKYNFGSSGIGTYPHLMAELFKWRAGGLFVVHIPYRGTGLVITDLVSGQIGYLMDSIVSAQPHLRDGKVKALAVSGSKRSSSLPNVPTFSEAGVPGLELSNWFGVFAPANTPRPIIDRLNREINAIAKQADVVERLERAGADPTNGTPEQFGKVIRDEFEGWKSVIKRANIKPE
jgi:tripartite-type tricarboxylate transporter receptor subunit TctC